MNFLEKSFNFALNFASSELENLTAQNEINYNGIKDCAETAFKDFQADRPRALKKI